MTEPTHALIMSTLKGTHRTGHRAAIWMKTRNVNLGDIPAVLCESVEGRALVWVEVLACSFRGGDELGSHPVGDVLPGSFGRSGDEGVFVGGESHGAVDGAGVVGAWSSGSGHAGTIALTESP